MIFLYITKQYVWHLCDSTIFLFLRVLLIKKEKKLKMKLCLNHLCKGMNKRLDTLVSLFFQHLAAPTEFVLVFSFLYKMNANK